MENLMFPDKTPEERASMLDANAYLVEVDNVKRHYTPEQLASMRIDFTAESVVLGDLEEEKSSITKSLNESIKEKKKVLKPLLKRIRKGYAENTETVYAFDDQEAGKMHYYDIEGVYLHSRPLLPSERQTKIHSLSKQA